MKLTIREETSPPPPKRVTLDLSEEEAGFLQYIASYFASDGRTLVENAAKTLAERLEDFRNKEKYPYTDYFKENV